MAEKIEAKEERITALEKHRSAWIRYGKATKAAEEAEISWAEKRSEEEKLRAEMTRKSEAAICGGIDIQRFAME